MEKLVLIIFLFSFQAFAVNGLECGDKLKAELNQYAKSKKIEADPLSEKFVKSFPCLGKEKFLPVNLAVLELYVASNKAYNNFERFELLYPFYKEHQKFFESKVLSQMKDEEKEIIKSHYSQYQRLIEEGNG